MATVASGTHWGEEVGFPLIQESRALTRTVNFGPGARRLAAGLEAGRGQTASQDVPSLPRPPAPAGTDSDG